MAIDLTPEECALLRTVLLAELEAKRVELHHARNMEYKAELKKQEKLLQEISQRLG
jgi:hypothetical protein